MDENNNVSGKYISKNGESFDVKGNVDNKLTFEGNDGTKIEMEADEYGDLDHVKVNTKDGYMEIDKDGNIKGNGKDPETGVTFEIESNQENGFKYKDSDGNYINIDKDGQGEAHLKNDEGELKLTKDGSFSYKGSDGSSEELKKYDDGSTSWNREDENGDSYSATVDAEGNLKFTDKDGTIHKASFDKEGNYEYEAPDGSKLKISKDSTLTLEDPQGNSVSYTKKEIDDMVVKHENELNKSKNSVQDFSKIEGGK